ncbi:Metallo-dependent phosphatase-like protein [Gigaspora rosea]|uniref:Metallo-dependent phosphatase-like protein n=1 Tax=Gigaspora rosea TaxID=44941 RepID=A0A397VRB0_9GLOM|nr:Metallo-dependent phosphatase-like protein [Gigaspora rosea]
MKSSYKRIFDIYNISFIICFFLLFNKSYADNKSNGTINPKAAVPYPKVFKENYNVKKLDFLVIGDWGYKGNGTGQASVAAAMKNWAKWNNSQFVINVGDNFYQIDDNEYDGILSLDDPKFKTYWLDVYTGRLADIPWFTVAGNHDWYANVSALLDYYWLKDNRFFIPSLYYVRKSTFGRSKTEVAWIHIDTNPFAYFYGNLTDKNQLKANLATMNIETSDQLEGKLNWIEEQLKAVQNTKWIFVVGDCSKVYYFPRLRSLFEKYRVTAYFAGHNHVLEMEPTNATSHVTYFTSGAGGKFDLEGCKGATWGSPGGTMGFLHVSIEDGCDQMYYEYVNATTAGQTPQVVKQGYINVRTDNV